MRRSPPSELRSALAWALPLLAVLLVLGIAIAVFVWLSGRPGPAPAPPTGPQVVEGAAWSVYFTEPLIPDDPAHHRGGLDERLVALMDSATRTLDVAVYDLDLLNVAEAMARAAQRGVRVRLVTDTETIQNTRDEQIQAALAVVRDAGIPLVHDQRGAIMHHKFTVVDGEVVQTGSWNYTEGDTYRLNNNMAIFRSPQLAANYTAEFEKLFVQRRFGPSKPAGVPFRTPEVAGLSYVENLFAPQDKVGNRIVDWVSRAERKIHFLAFSFTHDGIGTAMLERARAGVEVAGVFETTGSNTQFSEFTRLKAAGLDVYQDGSPYALHHKVIILDDRVTLFGSFNFSANADESNDENLLIVDDPRFAAAFEQEFQRMLALAKNPPARR